MVPTHKRYLLEIHYVYVDNGGLAPILVEENPIFSGIKNSRRKFGMVDLMNLNLEQEGYIEGSANPLMIKKKDLRKITRLD